MFYITIRDTVEGTYDDAKVHYEKQYEADSEKLAKKEEEKAAAADAAGNTLQARRHRNNATAYRNRAKNYKWPGGTDA